MSCAALRSLFAVSIHAAAQLPPNSRSKRYRDQMAAQAKQAVKILERGMLVTDKAGYGSRPSARDRGRRLAATVAELEGWPRQDLRIDCRLMRDGWHWWLSSKSTGPPG